MKRTNSFVWGVILLLVGILVLLSELRIVEISRALYAPILMIALAVVFHLYYFLTRGGSEGLLVPGGILLTYGILFLLDALNMSSVHDLWPLFILGPALGLFELYVFSRGKVGSMIPVFILTAIGGSFLLMNFGVASFQVVLAVLLVAIGVGLMINAFFHSNNHHNKQYNYTYTNPAPQQPADGAQSETPPPVDQKPEQ